jgi:hypothetical protein
MSQSEIDVRQATGEDAAAIARLLHDFNLEYSEPTPEVATLTDTVARHLYESMGFTNKEGGPDGPAMLFYEREL